MRILVSGSRSWTDVDTIWGALDILAEQARGLGETVTVVHGCAVGADIIADRWVRDCAAKGWPVHAERHPADWKLGRRSAGHERNRVMVDAGADVCLAFVGPCTSSRCRITEPHGSHGATGCIELAERAGIPVQAIERWKEQP